MVNGTGNFILLAVPFFILAGLVMERGGISIRLVRFIYTVVGHMRGGLLQVTVASMYVVSGLSGSKPAEAIRPHIDDFHKWAAWSPWEKLDPAMQRTFSGVASGKGAIYEWLGNSKAGQGRMEITESQPPLAHPPMKIPGHGTFAIYIQGGIHHGLWQL